MSEEKKVALFYNVKRHTKVWIGLKPNRVALSDSDASVVSPFTAKSLSPMAVVDLLREGRGALATSFASWKFIISYGL